MKELRERILREGKVLAGGILKVDSFLNHQLDPQLTLQMGREFRAAFEALGVEQVEKIVTVEASGIAPALATAIAYDAPLVFAKKSKPLTMDAALEATAPSATRGGEVRLRISPDYIAPGEKTLVIDDFLASGKTVQALARLLGEAGAKLVGAGFVIEKRFQDGRGLLEPLGIPLVSLACVEELRDTQIVLRP